MDRECSERRLANGKEGPGKELARLCEAPQWKTPSFSESVCRTVLGGESFLAWGSCLPGSCPSVGAFGKVDVSGFLPDPVEEDEKKRPHSEGSG